MQSDYLFKDRIDAGKQLAAELSNYHFEHPLILALPRGGVPVAKEVAHALKAPMDVLIVRKIGAPFNEEYGIGGMCEDFVPLFNEDARLAFAPYASEIEQIVDFEKSELKRRIKYYRGKRSMPSLLGRTVILVDDGIATGITAAAAAKYLKGLSAKEVIIASPVCPMETGKLLKQYADQVICLHRPRPFAGVGQWYRNFEQVSDGEVIKTIKEFHPGNFGEVSYV